MADIISANAITEINNEPRIRDLDLADCLNISRARDIRQVILKNRDELELHGSLRVVTANPGNQGGRPSKSYYLNEGQVLVICALSRTEKAVHVRKALIDVFMAYRNGKLVSPTPASQKHTHRVRQAKLALVSAVNRLDNLGIDVASIAMPDVLAFSRQINRIGGAK